MYFPTRSDYRELVEKWLHSQFQQTSDMRKSLRSAAFPRSNENRDDLHRETKCQAAPCHASVEPLKISRFPNRYRQRIFRTPFRNLQTLSQRVRETTECFPNRIPMRLARQRSSNHHLSEKGSRTHWRRMF